MVKRWHQLVGEGHAFHVSVSLNEKRMPIPDHGHDFAEVFWVEEGRGIHRVNGRSLDLAAGDLTMIRPGDHHGLLAKSGEVFRLENVAFNRKTLDRLKHAYFPNRNTWFWAQGELPFSLPLQAEQRSLLQKEIQWIRNAPRDQFRVDGFVLNLFRILEISNAPLISGPPWLQSALSRFGSPEDLKHGVRRFFELTGRTQEHVARTMLKHTGQRPTEWVNARRLGHAARLLESTALSVTEIADLCGFDNLSYFHRCFRHAHGITPRGHRLRQRQVM